MYVSDSHSHAVTLARAFFLLACEKNTGKQKDKHGIAKTHVGCGRHPVGKKRQPAHHAISLLAIRRSAPKSPLWIKVHYVAICICSGICFVSVLYESGPGASVHHYMCSPLPSWLWALSVTLSHLPCPNCGSGWAPPTTLFAANLFRKLGFCISAVMPPAPLTKALRSLQKAPQPPPAASSSCRRRRRHRHC